MSIKDGIKDIVGKKIKGVVVKESYSLNRSPRSQVFLLFSDDTYYEFYTERDWIDSISRIREGDLESVRGYLSEDEDRRIVCEYYDETITD